MKKIAVLVLSMALLIPILSAVPVMAIGPDQAFDVGLNPNLFSLAGALHNERGAAGGNVLWFESSIGYMGKWEFFDAASGQGKMNNAIIASGGLFILQYASDETAYLNGQPTVDENKWIFMSPEGSGNQFQFPLPSPLNALGSHGMIWWFFYFGFGRSVTFANQIAAEYPNGVFYQYTFIKLV